MSTTVEIKQIPSVIQQYNFVDSGITGWNQPGLSCYFLNDLVGWIVGNAGMIRKTVDAGKTWIDQRFIGSTEILTTVVFKSSNVGYINSSALKLYKTVNGGTTWTHIWTAPNSNNIRRINFLDDNIGFVGLTGGEVYKTIDGGENWTAVTITGTIRAILCIEIVSEDVIYVGCDYGTYYKSVDGGENFTATTISGFANQIYSMSFINSNVGFAVGRYGKYFKTYNGGTSWTAYELYYTDNGNPIRYVKMIDYTNVWFIHQYGEVSKSVDGGTLFKQLHKLDYGQWGHAFDRNRIYVIGNRIKSLPLAYECIYASNYTPIEQYDWVDYTDYISEIGTINKAQESDIIGEVGVTVMENTSVDLIYKGLLKTWFDAIVYESVYALRIKYYGNIEFEGVIDTSTVSLNRKEYTVSFEAVDKISALDMIELPLQREYRKIDTVNLSSPVKGDVHVKCWKDSVTRYEIIIEPKYNNGSDWVAYPELLSVRSDSIKSKNGITISFSKTVNGEVTSMDLVVKYIRWSAPSEKYYILQAEQDWFVPSVVSPNQDIPEAPDFCDNTDGYDCYIYSDKLLGEDIGVNWVEYQTNALGGNRCLVDRASETLWVLSYEEYLFDTWTSVTYPSTSEYYIKNCMYITMPTQDGKTYCKGKVKDVYVVGATFFFGLDDVYGLYPYDPVNDVYPLVSSDKTILVEKAESVYTIEVSGSDVEYNYGVKSFDWTKVVYALVKTMFTEITTIEIGLLDRTFDLYYYMDMYKDNAVLGKSALDAIKFLLDANNCSMYIKNNTLTLKKRQDVTADATTYTIDDSANNTNLLKLIENAFWEKAIDAVELTIESRLRRNDGSFVDTTYTKTKYAVNTIEPKNQKTLTIPYQRFFVGAVGDEQDIINELNIYALEKADEILNFYSRRHTQIEVELKTDSVFYSIDLNCIVDFLSNTTLKYFVQSVSLNTEMHVLSLTLVSVDSYEYKSRLGIVKQII